MNVKTLVKLIKSIKNETRRDFVKKVSNMLCIFSLISISLKLKNHDNIGGLRPMNSLHILYAGSG